MLPQRMALLSGTQHTGYINKRSHLSRFNVKNKTKEQSDRFYSRLMLNVTFPCKCLMNETVRECDSLVNHIGNDELLNAEIILN